MTKKNLNLNADGEGIFLLEPAFKETIWGGNKLREKYRKSSELANIAESWECSVHPQGLSKVASGKYKGMYLRDVLAEHPEYLGNKIKSVDDFPFLIKFIDAREKLSVQVHPNDDYAKKYENGSLGKTEMWYVVEAESDAEIVYGFYDDISKQQLTDGTQNGDIEKYLNKVRTHPGDVFFIPAGTVHGIGAGNLIVEVQENSDLTYRLYDYDRVDTDGKKRTLHLHKALDVINYKKFTSIRQPMRLLSYRKNIFQENLCRCKNFSVDRFVIKTKKLIRLDFTNKEFNIVICIDGNCKIVFYDRIIFLNKGDSLFVSSIFSTLSLCGNMSCLIVH